MTTALALSALALDDEWADVAPRSLAAAVVPAAVAAAEELVAEGLHVHLVGADVRCLTHACLALPGA
ncbi:MULTISPECIES: hypothetical protein [unclassified Streptomyces]|uniref:hypothetical protein n=1 Tax=unclassified Streptomyces TaxID=2593676 RepID=UPI0036476034